VHTFTPRMKNASDASNALRLEIYHPRTVHIFSRVLDMNEQQTTTDASAFASVARQPQREAFLSETAFPGVTSALKRRRTPGYSPTTPAGWYSQLPRVHASLRETRPMCTFLKNRVRFASRAKRLTCTKILAHVYLYLQKWCITTYTDVCTTIFVSFSAPSACSAVDFVVRCAVDSNLSSSSRRPALPWNNARGVTNLEACTNVHIFHRTFCR